MDTFNSLLTEAIDGLIKNKAKKDCSSHPRCMASQYIFNKIVEMLKKENECSGYESINSTEEEIDKIKFKKQVADWAINGIIVGVCKSARGVT